MTITSVGELRSILRSLNEDERANQRKMAREIKSVRQRTIEEKEDDEKEKDEKKPSAGQKPDSEKKPAATDDESTGEQQVDSGDETSGEDDDESTSELPGASELLGTDPEIPPKLKSINFVDRINKIRAGQSLKDKEVQAKIAQYVNSLDVDSKSSLYVYLDALARIILADQDVAEVPVPKRAVPAHSAEEKAKSNKEPGEAPKSKPSTDGLPIAAPITLPEGVIKRLREIDVPVRSGRVVPFGSKAHVADLERAQADIERIRSYQSIGSDTRSTLGQALSAVRKILASARRASEIAATSGNPRVQPASPIVENE